MSKCTHLFRSNSTSHVGLCVEIIVSVLSMRKSSTCSASYKYYFYLLGSSGKPFLIWFGSFAECTNAIAFKRIKARFFEFSYAIFVFGNTFEATKMKVFLVVFLSCSAYISQAYFLPKYWSARLAKYNGKIKQDILYFENHILMQALPLLAIESCDYYITSEQKYRERIQIQPTDIETNETITLIRFYTLTKQPFQMRLTIKGTPTFIFCTTFFILIAPYYIKWRNCIGKLQPFELYRQISIFNLSYYHKKCNSCHIIWQ